MGKTHWTSSGVLLFLAATAFVKTWLAHAWGQWYPDLLLCYAGLIAWFFPEEFNEYEGRRVWRSSQWAFPLPSWTQVGGGLLVVICAGRILLC